MKWGVSKVSIPVFDLEESINFYNFILGNDIETKINDVDFLDEYYICGGNIELRLYKLKNELSNNHSSQSRRTFPTLAINNLDLIVKSLKDDGINYSINKHDQSIIIQEPGLNFIELINLETSKKISNKEENNKWNFHHINLECYDVRSSVNFVSQYLKMKEGAWKAPFELGKVNIKPNQLAIFNLDNNHSGIHINKADFTFSWRNNFMHNPTIGGHPAFNVKDIKLFLKKLKSSDIAVTDAKIYAMPNIHQIYFFDPSANIIEVNQNIN
jgi:catechol 2,3-dioxygenase-like lactoylglutathione lyase family enzyme